MHRGGRWSAWMWPRVAQEGDTARAGRAPAERGLVPWVPQLGRSQPPTPPMSHVGARDGPRDYAPRLAANKRAGAWSIGEL